MEKEGHFGVFGFGALDCFVVGQSLRHGVNQNSQFGKSEREEGLVRLSKGACGIKVENCKRPYIYAMYVLETVLLTKAQLEPFSSINARLLVSFCPMTLLSDRVLNDMERVCRCGPCLLHSSPAGSKCDVIVTRLIIWLTLQVLKVSTFIP